jgi:hypothetical protein
MLQYEIKMVLWVSHNHLLNNLKHFFGLLGASCPLIPENLHERMAGFVRNGTEVPVQSVYKSTKEGNQRDDRPSAKILMD